MQERPERDRDGSRSKGDTLPSRMTPQPRGEPVNRINSPNQDQETPQARVVGGTFEFSFTLPKAANRSNPNGRKNKAENGGHQKATHAAKGENACPTQPATDSTALKTPSKPRASLPALEMRQERELPLRAENRKHRKALGLCKDCSNKAIPGQSRCPDCAGKNRQRHRAKEH